MSTHTRLLLIAFCLGAVAIGLSSRAVGTPQNAVVTRAAAADGNAFRLTGPHQHENLTIYLVHGVDRSEGVTYLTLAEGLQQKLVVVHETGDVNRLAVENRSDKWPVYVQAGEIVRGGKQDRLLGVDLILPPRSGRVPIQSFCVEQGRWRQRGSESDAAFCQSNNVAASPEILYAAKVRSDQGQVWAGVASVQDRLARNTRKPARAAESPSSFELTLELPAVKTTAAQYEEALSKICAEHEDALGYVALINGRIHMADVYASPALFKKLWPRLLKALAVEAIARRNEKAADNPPTVAAIERFLVSAENVTAEQQDHGDRVRIFTRQGENILLTETWDTQHQTGWLHRSYLVPPEEVTAPSEPDGPIRIGGSGEQQINAIQQRQER